FFLVLILRVLLSAPLFPYTTLFRSVDDLRGDRDVDPGLADDLRGIEDEAVRGAAEAGAGHPRDRVDVDVELRPDERVDEMEAPADCGGVEGGPADRLIGFVGIEHTDRDAGTSAVRHVTTILRSPPPRPPNDGAVRAGARGGGGGCRRSRHPKVPA